MTKPHEVSRDKVNFAEGDAVVRFQFLSLTLMLIGCGLASAQPAESVQRLPEPWSEFRLSEDAVVASPSARRATAEAYARQRRERAAYEAQQRALRREVNAWLGVSPLRPNWPSTPITHSYYQPRRIIYVPILAH